MRLQKYLAHCGVASRRKSEELIRNSQVTVNGNIIIDPAYDVKEEDQVKYMGKLIKFENTKVFKFYKPIKVISSVSDDRDRKTVLDFYKGNLRLYPVGRLDYMSEGLMLLTNDGELAQKLTHPSYEKNKIYEVKVDRKLTKNEIFKLKSGIIIDNYKTQKIDIVEKKDKYIFTLREGRNRQIRKMLDTLKVKTLKLKRIKFDSIDITGLKPGDLVELTTQEYKLLYETCNRDKQSDNKK